MNIGDKVRLIHGKEEGRVTKIIGTQQIEIEISDGFRIPVLKNEVVLIAAEEKTIGSNSKPSSKLSNGIYLAWTPFNDKITELQIVNDCSFRIFYALHEIKGTELKLIHSGILQPATFITTCTLDLTQFEQWPSLDLQVIYLHDEWQESKSPCSKRLKLKAAAFFNNKSMVPVSGKQGYIVRTDQDAKQVLTSEIQESIVKANIESSKVNRPANEIDLHIEKLSEHHSALSNSEILRIQLEVFQKNFDNAIATGMDQIVFIHGIGNGVLKKEIQKKISGHKHVAFFQDARKDKFGYGATLIKFK